MTNPTQSEIDKQNGFCPTPLEAVLPLIPFIQAYETYIEPCAGGSDLIGFLEDKLPQLMCVGACDINPKEYSAFPIDKMDCFDFLKNFDELYGEGVCLDEVDAIITNPPYSRHHTKLYHKMIADFSALKPTWLLLPGRFAFNVIFAPFMAYCHDVVTIGLVRWYAGTKDKESKDVAWYHFDQNRQFTGTKFHPYKKYEKEAA